MLIDDVCALKCEATVRSRMEDLKKLALSVLVREAASRLGFANVKPQQMEAILAFCQGKDVFVSLPTGFGKTLIFAVLPSLFNTIRQSTTSIVVVVSPLAALMAEQRKKFIPMAVNAEFLGELQLDQQAISRVLQGNHELVLVSPESLCYNKELRDMLLSRTYQDNLVAFVVDEAHCIKTWLVLWSILMVISILR